QAPLFDVLSPMPYHARFGHADDPGWISRQLDWLGDHLGIDGSPDARPRVWPIVQLSDWGEPVPAAQVRDVLDHGTRAPSPGVLAFAWSGRQRDREKVGQLGAFYRELAGDDAAGSGRCPPRDASPPEPGLPATRPGGPSRYNTTDDGPQSCRSGRGRRTRPAAG